MREAVRSDCGGLKHGGFDPSAQGGVRIVRGGLVARPVRMDRGVKTRRVDSVEWGQISSVYHDNLTDRLWGGLDDRTDREPGDQQRAESMGRSVLPDRE